MPFVLLASTDNKKRHGNGSLRLIVVYAGASALKSPTPRRLPVDVDDEAGDDDQHQTADNARDEHRVTNCTIHKQQLLVSA